MDANIPLTDRSGRTLNRKGKKLYVTFNVLRNLRLRNFQTKLDVIGNNIANVNTYGFKKGRTIFKDLISQTVAGASAPSATAVG